MPPDHRTDHRTTADAAPGWPEDAADETLIERIAGHDVTAFEVFFRRHYRRLFRILLLATSRADLAEELVNETMHVVWRKAESFRGEARVSSWLHGIALRRAGKALRRRGPVTEPLQAWHEDLPDTATGAEAVEREQLRLRLPSLLSTLSAAQRVAVELAYLHGHSMDEIAMLTGVPTGTVKTRLFQARARLRAAFDPHPSPADKEPPRR